MRSSLLLITLLCIQTLWAQPRHAVKNKTDWRDNYEFTSKGYNGRYIVIKDDLYGLCDKTGKVLLPVEYKNIQILNDSNVLFSAENGMGWMNQAGKIIFHPRTFEEETDWVEDSSTAENIHQTENGLYEVTINGKIGLYSKTGEKLLPHIYDQEIQWMDVSEGRNGYGVITCGTNYGLINSKGKVLIPPVYTYLTNANQPNRWIASKDMFYGILDTLNQPLIPFQYTQIEYLPRDHFVVELNGKRGIVNSKNEMLIPAVYELIYFTGSTSYFNEAPRYYLVLSREKKITLLRPADYSVISSDRYERIDQEHYGLFRVSVNGKWGYMDTTGKEIITPAYDDINYFYLNKYAGANKNGKWGMIDRSGNVVVLFEYDGISQREHYIDIVKNKKWGLLDSTFHIRVEPLYDERIEYFPGAAIKNGKFGWLGENGQVLADFIYDDISPRSLNKNPDQLYRTRIGQLWGLIDRNGKVLYEPQFEQLETGEGILYYASKNNKWGLIGREGKWITPIIYDQIRPIGEGLITASKDGLYALFDSATWNNKTPHQYSQVQQFSEGLLSVCLNGKYGYVDKQARVIIPFQFEESWAFVEGLACMRQGNKWGYINRLGKIAITPQFDYCVYFSGGKAYTQKNRQKVILNINGTITR